MFGQLFIKECRQTLKSLIFWLIVLGLVLDFFTQLGKLEIMTRPAAGQEDYGYHTSMDKEVIMESTLGALAEEYSREEYTTYPIGFYKKVTLSEEETRRIEEIIKETTGLESMAEVEQAIEDYWNAGLEQDAVQEQGQDAVQEQGQDAVQKQGRDAVQEQGQDVVQEQGQDAEQERNQDAEQERNRDAVQGQESARIMRGTTAIKPVKELTYERFTELMEEADDILGGGSNYGEEYREKNAQVPMTYEEALEEYELLIEKDRLAGGYARLFSDYMVIFLGILPVFLAVIRGLRDRRAGMQELIYTRKGSSVVIIFSRYLAMLAMLMLPVLVLSVIPLTQCVEYGTVNGVSVDMSAFVKYTFGWLVPTIMIVLAVGMFVTELTNTAAAVLVQGAWWFVSIFSGAGSIGGGVYGWNLAPRHNTELNWIGYHDGFPQLMANRIFYAAFALVLIGLTALVYSQKRKGRLVIRGKILADRKNKLKA